jgi:hypothetical protein
VGAPGVVAMRRPYLVVVSSVGNGLVRRRRFASLAEARRYANRFRPWGKRPSKGEGYRAELSRMGGGR